MQGLSGLGGLGGLGFGEYVPSPYGLQDLVAGPPTSAS